MLQKDQKTFRYLYKFPEKPLIDFIRERYFQNAESEQLEEIVAKRVMINGKRVSPNSSIVDGDWLEYMHYRSDEEPFSSDLTVLYEDEELLAISKPDYLPVTPSSHYYFNSIAILVKERLQNEEISPVHRLDIETSGVLLFGKSKQSRRKVQMMFQENRIDKSYQAIVFNEPTTNEIYGELKTAEESKIYSKLILTDALQANSLTLIKNQQPWGDFFRVWLKPITGKTNQIRAHLAAIGCSIVGDKKYYPDESIFLDWFVYRDIERILPQIRLERQALHCESLSFKNPFTNEHVTIEDKNGEWLNKINTLLS